MDSEKNHYHRKVNPCRPGYNASCALCCGSHNFVMPPEKINSLFLERGRKYHIFMKNGAPPSAVYEYLAATVQTKKYSLAIQCPFMGYNRDGTILGCLAYDDSNAFGKEHHAFFVQTCQTFCCQAWDKLSDQEISLAAFIMRDWFYYSLLIHNILELKEFSKRYSVTSLINKEEIEALKCRLLSHFTTQNMIDV